MSAAVRAAPAVGVLVLLALPALPATASPIFTAAECNEPNVSGWNDDPGDPIWVYFEADMGDEMSECLSGSQTLDGITNTQFIYGVLAGMDIWNRQSRAPILRMGGTLPKEDADDACSSMTNKPAVFVQFHQGCYQDTPGPGACTGTRDAAVRKNLTSCANTAELIFYGDKVDKGHDNCGTSPRDWEIDGESEVENDIVSVAVHEFGHVLDLGHADEATGGDSTDGHGVMAKPLDDVKDRHLFPWDMDCVDDAAAGNTRGVRDLKYAWHGITSSGAWASSGDSSSSSNDISKGFSSGGYLRLNGGQKYGYYDPADELWVSSVGTNGDFTFAQQSDFNSDLEDLYITPVLMSPLERSGTNQDHRIAYPHKLTGSISSYDEVDPPQWRYRRSDDYFVNSTWGTYRECSDTSCTTNEKIQSNIPLVSAYDDYSNKTVFVSVDTGGRDSDDRSFAEHGEIRVYPGFYSTSSNKLLPGEVLSDERSPPSDIYGPPDDEPDFAYSLKTDSAPGVACAKDRVDHDYNCLLMWQDRGIPDGRVLYTYFRVNGTDIEWGVSVYVRSGAYTVGDIAAAYFEDAFWVAWKYFGVGSDVAWTKNDSSSYTSWSTVAGRGLTDVAGTPAWLYSQDDDAERALIWTEVD